MLGCVVRRSIRRRASILGLDVARDYLVHKIFRTTSKGSRILPYSQRCLSTSTSSSTTTATTKELEPVSKPDTPSNNDYGLYRLLKVNEREWLQEQRQLTATAQRLARQVGGGVSMPHNSTFLQELQLDSTFSVVVAGEFNAGKSTLINALLGKKLLESGALPTTDSVTIVASPSSSSSNEKGASSALPLGVVMHTVPDLELLQDLTLVDTPGTNSTWLDHTEQTLRLLPAADLILFCTSADRPFPESERQLLQQIQTYRKSIVMIINKMDILDAAGGDHGQDPKKQVVEFVTDQAATILGARPMVIPVSSRDALTAKFSKKSAQLTNVWERSNFAALEHYLQSSLTTQAKLKSKLSSPIGVAEGVMAQCLQVLEQQGQELEADIATLNIFNHQFVGWKKEMSADLMISRNEMSDRIRAQGERCDVLLNRVSYFDLYKSILDMKQLEQEWDETSSSLHSRGLESDLLDQVQETADSVATRGRAQGQAVIEYLGKRPAMKNQSLVGSVMTASKFEDTRRILAEKLTQAVQASLPSTKDGAERQQLLDSLRQTALLSATLHTGALSSVVAVAAELVDPIAGTVSASSLVMGGALWLMTGTSRIRNQYQNEWTNRAKKLDASLETVCQKELDRVNRRILDGVAPYTRFVESEQDRMDQLREECEGVTSAARNLRNRISKLG